MHTAMLHFVYYVQFFNYLLVLYLSLYSINII